MDTEAPPTALEVDMKAIVLLSQILPAVVMANPNLIRLGTIPIAPISRRDIKEATSGELPKDLGVCPEVMLKQCDPKNIFKERQVTPR